MFAGVTVYSFECDVKQARDILSIANDHCLPAVKDIENALTAADVKS